jgi:hypothetical protein
LGADKTAVISHSKNNCFFECFANLAQISFQRLHAPDYVDNERKFELLVTSCALTAFTNGNTREKGMKSQGNRTKETKSLRQ